MALTSITDIDWQLHTTAATALVAAVVVAMLWNRKKLPRKRKLYFQQKRKCKVNKTATCNSKSATSSVSVIHRFVNAKKRQLIRFSSVYASCGKLFYYSALPPRKAVYSCDDGVCLSVCLPVWACLWNYTRPIFTKRSVHVTCNRSSALRCRRSDVLCISGFIDDVIFARKPRLPDVAPN